VGGRPEVAPAGAASCAAQQLRRPAQLLGGAWKRGGMLASRGLVCCDLYCEHVFVTSQGSAYGLRRWPAERCSLKTRDAARDQNFLRPAV
jgi:hypothetical protein